MAWVITLSLLLAVLFRTILTGLDFKKEGEVYYFDIFHDPDYYCLLFRTSAEEKLLLWNTSNPSAEISNMTAEFRSRLELRKYQDPGQLSHFRISSLILSDSGQYRLEYWRNGIMQNQDTNLLVCRRYNEKVLYVYVGDAVDLSCEGTRDNETMTVQWYMGLDSKKQLPENSSSLHVNISVENSQYGLRYSTPYFYSCVLLEEQLCVSFQNFYLYNKRCYLVVSVGEEAVLSCFNPDDLNGTKTQRSHNLFGGIIWDFSPLTRREKQRYVTDERRSGNESLIIPSLMLNHSGTYVCRMKNDVCNTIKSYELLVLPKSETEPLTEFFSEGDQGVVRCNSDITYSHWVVWYRRTAEVEHVFWSTRYNEPYLSQDLEGRIIASTHGFVMVLSNLSLKDTGEYVCIVFYSEECFSVTKTLLLEWDLFGINSTFYSVYVTLMGCALLGMVCALITVNLKTSSMLAQTPTEEQ